jgi:hypothetical protein
MTDAEKLKKLNELMDGFLDKGRIPYGFKPIIISGEESITIIPTTADAFCLNPLIAGARKDLTGGSIDNNAAVSRTVISYYIASIIANDQKLFYYYISNIINSFLITLTKALGDLTFREVIMARPGAEADYFIDLEDTAGYELRAYVREKTND